MAYTGQTAYVTGGASGIGRSLVEALSSKGMKVFVADRNLEGAQEVANSLNKSSRVAWPVQIDVSDWNSQRRGFEAAVNVLGRIDYVFPIAGISELPWLPTKSNATEFEKPDLSVWDINGTGCLYTFALAIQQFRRQEPNSNGFRGKIIAVASGSGFYYIPGLPVYTASKHAIVGFVRTLGQLLPEEGITLNAICPNIVKTGISTGDFYDRADARGLLITLNSLVASFEVLLGADKTSGEAIELLPGDGGSRIKERPEYTDPKCKESVELVIDRTSRPAKPQ